LKHKNKHVLIRKFNATSNEKNYHHPTFIQYKKSPNNLFSLYHMKNKLHNKKGKKNSRGKKIKKFQIFLKAFFKYKNKRAFKKKIQPNLK
jgi:zona occludens toxin (predicted ATPase)